MSDLAIVGANGQVARALVRLAAEHGLSAVAGGRGDADLGSAESVRAFLEKARPQVVINAAAYTAVDKAESEVEAADLLNGVGPGVLATWCAEARVPLVHLSTDYVFNGGGTRPYVEDDPVEPQSAYGRSKAMGEAAVRAALREHVILRTAWVYDEAGQNFLNTMLRLAATREEIGVVADQRGSPTYAGDLATAILQIAGRASRQPDGFPWGTYHAVNRGETTWAGFAQEIFRQAGERGLKVAAVKAITTADYPTPARRPAYSVLDTTKLERGLGVALPTWQDGLERCLERRCRSTS